MVLLGESGGVMRRAAVSAAIISADPAATRGGTIPVMTNRRRVGHTYLLLTILIALGCVAVGYILVGNLLEGQVWAGTKSAKRLVTASESPIEFGIRNLVTFVLWLLFCGYAWLRFRVWMNRDKHPEIFNSEVDRLQKTTSRTGNVLAWILAVPMILLVLISVIALAMGYGSR